MLQNYLICLFTFRWIKSATSIMILAQNKYKNNLYKLQELRINFCVYYHLVMYFVCVCVCVAYLCSKIINLGYLFSERIILDYFNYIMVDRVAGQQYKLSVQVTQLILIVTTMKILIQITYTRSIVNFTCCTVKAILQRICTSNLYCSLYEVFFKIYFIFGCL